MRMTAMLEEIAELVAGAERVQEVAVGQVAADDHDGHEERAAHVAPSRIRQRRCASRRGLSEQRANERVRDVVQRIPLFEREWYSTRRIAVETNETKDAPRRSLVARNRS